MLSSDVPNEDEVVKDEMSVPSISPQSLDKMVDSMVTVCASHLNCRERTLYFCMMIKSWARQRNRTKMYVSLSCSEEERQHVKDTILELTGSYLDLNISFKETPLTQFEHYRELLKDYNNCLKGKWLMFVDDDDILHPSRTAMYAQVLCSVDDPTEVGFVSLADFIEQPKTYGGSPPLTADDVQQLVDTKKMPVRSVKGNSNKYYMYVVPDTKLREFCNGVDENVILKHPLADLYFIRHVIDSTPKYIIVEEPPTWCYYQRYWSATQQQEQARLDTETTNVEKWAEQTLHMFFVMYRSWSKQKFKQFCRSNGTDIKAIKEMSKYIEGWKKQGKLEPWLKLSQISNANAHAHTD